MTDEPKLMSAERLAKLRAKQSGHAFVPELLAHIDALTESLTVSRGVAGVESRLRVSLQAELADERAAHAKTADNFAVYAGCEDDPDALVRLAKVEAERDRAQIMCAEVVPLNGPSSELRWTYPPLVTSHTGRARAVFLFGEGVAARLYPDSEVSTPMQCVCGRDLPESLGEVYDGLPLSCGCDGHWSADGEVTEVLHDDECRQCVRDDAADKARELAQRWAGRGGMSCGFGDVLSEEDADVLFAWVRAWCESEAVDEWAPVELAEALGLTHEQAALLGEAAGWPS